MHIPSKDEIKNLMQVREEPCVTICFPTHKAGSEVQQDPIRLKNSIRKAEEMLRQSGIEVNGFFSGAQALLNDYDFWQHQENGLAVFITRNETRTIKLPITVDETVHVSDHFYTKPILPLLSGDGQYFVLSLSQDQVHLYRATRHSINEVDLPADVPKSLAEALRFDDTLMNSHPQQVQFHTGAPGSDAIFHGHSAGSEDTKNDVRRFCQAVDKGLRQILKEESVPLVLAGVPYIFPIFREASHYQHIVEQGVEGNPDLRSANDIHQASWSVVEPYFQSIERTKIEDYHNKKGTGLASNNLEEICAAARFSRVATLFVSVGVEVWGTIEGEDAAVTQHPTRQDSSVDLLNVAATDTLLNGGDVLAVRPEVLPDASPIAAIFRY